MDPVSILQEKSHHVLRQEKGQAKLSTAKASQEELEQKSSQLTQDVFIDVMKQMLGVYHQQ